MYELEDLKAAFEAGRDCERNQPKAQPEAVFFEFLESLTVPAQPVIEVAEPASEPPAATEPII